MNGRKASDTVDGSEIRLTNQLRLVVNPIIDSNFLTCQVAPQRRVAPSEAVK